MKPELRKISRTCVVSERLELHEHAIEINGQRLVPDKTKAYVEFRAAHAFPVVTAYNSAFHAGTVANSFSSMRHQVFNFRHQMQQYFKNTDHPVQEDRILGSIVEVEFPRTPSGGWRLTQREQTPSLRGVAVLHKRAKGVDRIIGQHQSGRVNWAVSVEVEYQLADSGIVLLPADDSKKLSEAQQELLARHTPKDFAEAGYGYVPFLEASDDLLECYDPETAGGMFTQLWQGRQPITLIGGLDGACHFYGLGLVEYGAEPTAHVSTILAEDARLAALSHGLEKLQNTFARFEPQKQFA